MRIELDWIHPQHRGSLRLSLGVLVLLLGGLLLLARLGEASSRVAGFLTWHMLLEVMAIVVATLIFAVGWNTYALHRQRNILIASCAFLGVAVLDFSHMLSFPGMPDFVTPSDVQKGINFWLPARYLAAFALLALVWRPWQDSATETPTAQPSRRRFLPLLALLALLLPIHWLVLWRPELLPTTYVAGLGLTPLKRLAEGGVILLHLLAFALLLARLRQPSRFDVPLLLASLLTMIIGELPFALYTMPTDSYNLGGHVYKVLAYLLLYRAIFVETVAAPYRALEQARQHSQAILDAIPDRLFEMDIHGRHLAVHTPRNEQVRMPGEQLLGRTVHEALPAEAAAVCMAALQETLETGHSNGRQLLLRLDDGNEHRFELSVAPLRQAGQSVPHFIVLSRDVTARTREQESLRKLRQAVEQSPHTIVITDLQARIEYANQAFTTVTGYTLAEASGLTPRLLHSGKTPPGTYAAMWRQLRTGKPWRGEFLNRRKDGSEYHEAVLISPVFDNEGRATHYLAIMEDITQRKLDQQRIEHLAHFDALTGLPNRTLFRSRFEQALGMAERQHSGVALMFMDIDHFKNINDSLGHRVGDALLVQIAQRLQGALRDEDTLSRQGGDEFMLSLTCSDAASAAHLAERLRALLGSPFQIDDLSLSVSASIGIALYPDDGQDFDRLAQHADAAMYRAKQEGRDRHRFFTAELQAQSARMLSLENALRQALHNDELHLHYQPQLSIDGRRLVGAEALLRWNHPQMGAISPAEFIPVAESSGLILPIGAWVLRTAAAQMQAWLQQGMPADTTMAVNLSLAQFNDAGLCDLVATVLEETGLPAACLELELTESVAMHKPAEVIEVVRRLRELGVRLAIDDFGTGYSSLSYLKQFEAHKLKIDQSFVRNLSQDSDDQSIVQAILGLAHSLDMLAIAEGVETREQQSELQLLGCDEAQGYLFSRPLPAEAFEAWVRAWQARHAETASPV